MASSGSEPEKYSIDEMMDRLKRPGASQAAEEGTLVTREDGTQAIRIRKRKRRSRQPAKEQAQRRRRVRAVQIAIGLTLLFMMIFTAAGMLIYVNTSVFRTRLMTKLGSVTGGKVEASQLKVTPMGANATSLAVTWPDHSVLKKLSLNKVAADLRVGSFLGGGWTGEEVLAESAELSLGGFLENSGGAAGDAKNTFRFERIRSPKASIVVGDPTKPAIRVKDSEVSFYPRNETGRAELRMNRGTVEFGPGLPVFDLDRSLFVLNGGQIDRVALRLNPPDDSKAVLELMGAISSPSAARPATMEVKIAAFPVEQLSGKEMARFLTGPVVSRDSPTLNFLTFFPSQPDSYRLSAAWRSTVELPMKMSGLPCFSDFARVLEDGWFAVPVFDGDCHGVLRVEKSGVRLDELDLSAKNRMKLKGSLAVTGGDSLSGHLRIGLPVSFALSDSSGRLHQLLGPEIDGFRWVDVEVSGTSTKPADNFREKLATTHAKPVEPSLKKPETESKFEELTQPR